jgi:O-antigen/teichoic acid export membrane protein
VVEKSDRRLTQLSAVQLDSTQLSGLFRRGFAATFALDLVTSALSAATIVLLIRELSVSSYAYATLFLTFAQFAGASASGGVRTRYLREEAERVSRSERQAARGDFLESLLKGILLIGAFGLVAIPIASAAGFGSDVGGGTRLILYATGLAAAFSAVELASAHYQARRRFTTAGALRVVRALAMLGAALAITLTRESALAISLWFIGSAVVVAAVAVRPIARRSLMALRDLARLFRLRHEEAWLSFYYFAAGGFAYVDVMVAGALLSKHQVATLGASLRYLAVILGAIPALGAVLRVRASQADLVDSSENQRTMVTRWLRRAFLPTAGVVGLAIVVAPFAIPQIDGGRYPGSVTALQIYLVTAFIAYVTAPVPSILLAQVRYAQLASVYALGLLANLAGDVAVARRFGVTGIAVVSTSVYVAIDIAMLVLALTYASNRQGVGWLGRLR